MDARFNNPARKKMRPREKLLRRKTLLSLAKIETARPAPPATGPWRGPQTKRKTFLWPRVSFFYFRATIPCLRTVGAKDIFFDAPWVKTAARKSARAPGVGPGVAGRTPGSLFSSGPGGVELDARLNNPAHKYSTPRKNIAPKNARQSGKNWKRG